jgi:N-acetylmuramoyl-L-alanine amidase
MIGICIGHSRRIAGRRDGGAVSRAGWSEWAWNSGVAGHMQKALHVAGQRTVIVDAYQGEGYDAAMRWLAGHLKSLGVVVAVELHFNFAGPTATGHEWLHWRGSREGQRLAERFDARFAAAVPQLQRRGLKERMPGRLAPPGHNNRGWQFLGWTHCPAIIAEPFFGSNAEDVARVEAIGRREIGNAYALAVLDWLAGRPAAK